MAGENIDEIWKHGVLFSGLSQFGDIFYLANSYKLAGDRLIDLALEKEEAWNLFCPAVYNYRHATELYLKAITGCQKQTHNLNVLLEKFERLILDEYKEGLHCNCKKGRKGCSVLCMMPFCYCKRK